MVLYRVETESKRIQKNFDGLVISLSDQQKRKLMITFSKYPKSLPQNQRTEPIGRVMKKGKLWQYYAPDGYRVIYDVTDRPKIVIIGFVGNHNDAKIYLRNNA